MKLVKPKTQSVTPSGSGALRHSYGEKPAWLRQWIADRAQWVLLSCGHKDNMNDRAQLIIITQFKDVSVYCNRCGEFVDITRNMGFLEYADITAKTSQEPLF